MKMPKKYNYGKSIISSNLKYEFEDKNLKFSKIEEKFFIEIKVYCGRKKMYVSSNTFNNMTINDAIKEVFDKKIEKHCTFHEGYNYYATFKVYELKPVRRAIYEKTDNYIDTERRKYLLQERINIYF